MKKYISLLLTILFISSTVVTFAAPFPDLPADHWATQAVVVLAEKGLVEGYPNGTFRGPRAATRYEVAMIVARLLAYLEKTQPQVSKEDLDNIKRLVNEFGNELNNMGVRLKNVEDMLAALDKRVTELERVKWSGGLESRYATGKVSTCAGCTITPFVFNSTLIGSRTPPVGSNLVWNNDNLVGSNWNPNGSRPADVDQNALWDNVDLHLASREKSANEIEGYPFDRVYTAFPQFSGSALTEQGYLRVEAKLTNDYKAGGVISLYNDVGAQNNGFIYGVTPNTVANPFQAGTPAAFGVASTNLSTNLNQVYLTNQKADLNVAVGDWRPAYISSHLLQGLPNVGVFGPDYLPFYGGQVYGTTSGGNLKYEAVAGRLSVFNTTNYQNILYGGAVGYEWKNAVTAFPTIRLTGSFIEALNDIATVGGGTSGGVPNPGQWAASGSPLSANSLNVGPQKEILWGADLKVSAGDWANKMITFFGKYGNSKYYANKGAATQANVTLGNMASGGLNIGEGKRISGGGEYLWVEPGYDPFVAEIPIPTATFTSATLFYGFPYPVSYGPPYTGYTGLSGLTNGSGNIFYNLHDTREYPQNRRGYRAWTNWNYGRGNLGAKYENLLQVQISSPIAELTPGFVEPIFFTQQTYPIAGGGTATQPSAFTKVAGPAPGRVVTYQIAGDYTSPGSALTFDALYINNQIKRWETDNNNISLLMNWWRGGITYRPDSKWSLMTGYSQLSSGGDARYLQANTNGPNNSIPTTLINGATGPTVGPNAMTPANMRFIQRGPYVGANFAFATNAAAWGMFQLDNVKDLNCFVPTSVCSGRAGFSGATVTSGLRFIF